VENLLGKLPLANVVSFVPEASAPWHHAARVGLEARGDFGYGLGRGYGRRKNSRVRSFTERRKEGAKTLRSAEIGKGGAGQGMDWLNATSAEGSREKTGAASLRSAGRKPLPAGKLGHGSKSATVENP